MSLTVAVNNIAIQADPLNHWDTNDMTPEHLMASAGLVTMFVGLAFENNTERTAEGVVDMYSQSSGGGWSQDPIGSFTPEGVKQYPGDPDQYPIMAFLPLDPEQARSSDVDIIYLYEHEWVAFKMKDGTFKHLRMD